MSDISEEKIREAANGLVTFINNSPSPFHVVRSGREKLLAAGFQELSEKETWTLVKGGKYFLKRNESALIAFIVGGKFQSGNGITLIGSHTDSPCMRLKPNSKKNKSGFLSVGVQCYGGGLWNTWFDRDLTVAGRVMIKNEEGNLEHHLVHIKQPILRIPMLSIHLQREINSVGFKINKETHLLPVLATKIFEDEFKKQPPHVDDHDAVVSNAISTEDSEESKATGDSEASKHHAILIQLICKEIGCKPEDLVNMELCLADTQPAVIGGAYKEFIFAPRLDNQFNTYCAITGIIESSTEGIEDETNIRMISCYDNEEVGSKSAQGAASMLAELVIRRICHCFGNSFERSIANSFLLSVDQTFAINPNYPEKYEENHKPSLHKGPNLNFSANQKFSTTAITASVIRDIAKKCNVSLQDYVVRNDSTSGTTIGPILSSRLGIRTADIGGPMLSMHSVREMCGTTTVERMITLFKGYFRLFPKVDAGMKTD